MIFAPLFSVFEWLHGDSPRPPKGSAFSETAWTMSHAFALRDVEREVVRESDRPSHAAHPSSVSNGLSNSDYERLDGVVTIDIHPNRLGQIKFAGGWWSAKCGRAITLKTGTLVKIIGRENITLIVEPMGNYPHLRADWVELG